MKKFSSTMRESSRRTSRRERLKKTIAFGIVALLLVLLLPRVMGTLFGFVFSPISRVETWLADSSAVLPSYFRDRGSLVEENNVLRQKLANEHGDRTTVARLLEENIQLRGMLGEEATPRIAASVIGRPTVTPYDVIVLDKGEKDGVTQFAPVYIGIDQAIGYVAEVYRDTSVVVLVTTPGFESTVYIFGPNIYTTAEGIGGGVLQVSVPQGIPLAVNDLVVVPSFDSGVYGSIDVVNSVASEPEQRGYVTLDVPLQGIRFVSIGTAPLNPVSFDDAVETVSRIKKDLTKVPVPSGILVDVETATSTATATEEVIETDPTE